MFRFAGRLIAMRFRGAVAPRAALVAAALLAAAAAPAGATITPVNHDSPGAATAVRFAVDPTRFPTVGAGMVYSLPGGPLQIPPKGNPLAYADGASGLTPFPRDGTNFLVLSTGDAMQADDPDQPRAFPSTDDIGSVFPDRGAAALDATVLQIPFDSPLGPADNPLPSCLSFEFRFLSEEYPTGLNDAFVAELDSSTWSTSGTAISAPNNFASSPLGQPLTIKSAGVAAMSPAEAAGTPYGGATRVLRAQILVPAQRTHSILLSLFDDGDHLTDSAVFIDNLTLTPQPASCPTGLTLGGPTPVITGPAVASVVDTPTPTLTGTAGNAPGDADTVTVRIYGGALPTGTPLQARSVARTGSSWALTTDPLTPGQYTAQATQANGLLNGVSAPTTFTVLGPQGGSSQQQTPGDRDGDGIPDDQDTSDGSLPPIPGKTFDARVISGSVFIKYAPGKGPRAVTPPKGFVPLKGAANIPIGSQLDTRKGHVSVTSAANSDGSKTQAAEFYDAIFEVKQTVPKKKPKKPVAVITDLVLKGEPPRSECAPLKGAAAAAAKKKKRGGKSVLSSLWGSGKGKFRTNGKYSSATVRGTIWLTQDRCDGTLTTVKRGTVSVRDFKLKKTVSVKAGHSYLARAQRAASKAKRRTK